MVKKNLLTYFIAICLIFSSALPIYAENKGITVTIDGKSIAFDQPPIMVNNRVLVPMRAIFEALGYSVDWDETEDAVTGKKLIGNERMKYALRTKERTLWVNYRPNMNDSKLGEVDFTLPFDDDAPLKIINGRTLLTTRIIAESLGCTVAWDGKTQTVSINTSNAQIVYPENGWIERLEAHLKKTAPQMLFIVEDYRKKQQNGELNNPAITVKNSPQQTTQPTAIPKPSTAPTSTATPPVTSGQKTYKVFDSVWNKTFEYTYKSPVMATNPPVVGSMPGKIEKDSTLRNASSYSYQDYFTEWYADGGFSTGGCNWYAGGRFWEVYGIPFPHFNKFFLAEEYLNSAENYKEFSAIRDINDIRPNSLVVYGKGSDGQGHVAFVEYVERDNDGKPANIYITEANLNNPNGDYRYGVDGTVEKLSVTEFFNRSKPVIGYIIPNPNFYK